MIIKLNKFPKITLEKVEKTTGLFSINSNYNGKAYNVNNSIFFPKGSKINFWSFESNMAKKRKGNLVEMIFFGLNYNAKRLKYFRKPYVLDLQKSHKIKIEEARISLLKTKVFKRRILFWSFDRSKLKELTDNLKSKRPQNSYSGHGLISRTDKYAVKPGKIRQK